MIKTCLHCKKEFKTTHQKQKYCSRGCANQSKVGKKSTSNTKFLKCHVPWNRGKPRTIKEKQKISVSVKNGYINKPETIKNMRLRMKEYYANGGKHPMSGRKHTEKSKKLMSINSVGKQSKENHWNWKGGITHEEELIRKSKNYLLWRKSCFERDNFTCQISGQYGGELVVHHINNFADFPESRIAIDNGITMSKELHLRFHKTYGKKNNTKEQLEEFSNQLKIK